MSLGVVPVGVSRADWGGDARHYWPWVRAAIEARGAPLPALITEYPELDVEQIIALQPDVVLAPFSGMSARPTRSCRASFPWWLSGTPFLTPMDTQIDLIAAALGKRAEADAQGPHRPCLAARRATTQLAGKTFAYVRADLGSATSPMWRAIRVDTISAMGLALAPSVRQLRASTGHFAHYLGFEHADRLADVDILVSWFYNDAERDKTAAMPLFAAIPAVQARSLCGPERSIAGHGVLIRRAAGGGVDAGPARAATGRRRIARPPRRTRVHDAPACEGHVRDAPADSRQAGMRKPP